MHIERIYKSSIEKRSGSVKNRAGTILLFIAAAIIISCFFAGSAINKNRELASSPAFIVYIILATVFFFVCFAGGISLKSFSQQSGLIAYVRTENGSLYHVYVTSDDVSPESTLANNVSRNIRNAQIIDTRLKKEAFFCSDELDTYLRGIIEDNGPDQYLVRIQQMENIWITHKYKDRTIFMYTVGKHQLVFKAVAFNTLNNYEELSGYLSQQKCKINYADHVQGDYLID